MQMFKLGRRLRGLTLLETVMVLVVLGVVVVAALTAGQGLLDSRKAAVASDQIRLVVGAVEQVTKGRKDFRNLTAGSVRSPPSWAHARNWSRCRRHGL